MTSKIQELSDFERGRDYSFHVIEKFVDDLVELEEYGSESIGEQFLVLKEETYGSVISFVLSGASAKGYIYRCIYTSLVEE